MRATNLSPSLLLALILLIFTALALYNSIVLPIGEAADETDHYQYHRFVARTGHPPLTEAERREAGFKGGLAPLYYWLTAWPAALVGEESLPDIRRIDSRPERHIPTDGLGINHVLHTLDETWPWRGQILAFHLVRLLSIPLGWITIIATYLLARRLLPKSTGVALGAAALVAFLPRFVISSAVINDDNLVFALTALLLWVQVRLLQTDGEPSKREMALFGALFGLALVTKYFSLILIPEILLTLWLLLRATPQRAKPLLAFGAALFATAGPWFLFIAVRFNRITELGLIPGLAAALGEPQITEGLVGLLSGQSVPQPPAATYALLDWLGLLYRSFWFEYGWMRLFAPDWIYALFSLFAGLALAGLIRFVWVYRRGTARPIRPAIILLLGLHLTLFLAVVAIRYILSATIDTGQGRHLYPALPVIALALSLGLSQLISSRRLLLTPYSLYLFLSFTTLIPANYVLPHYQTRPVTIDPDPLPAGQQLNLPFADGLTLTGYQAAETIRAGESLPVTLRWHAEREAAQDYLLSICLGDDEGRAVACRRGYLGGSGYPARAWEAGDTIIDTVHLPIPGCYRLAEQSYRLQLAVWPVDPTRPEPVPLEFETPALRHTFTEPAIAITPTDSARPTQPQTLELWRDDARLTGPTAIGLRETLTQITYGAADAPAPALRSGSTRWQPILPPEPLYLPCDDGPEPFATAATFIAHPRLTNGVYSGPGLPPLAYSARDRLFAPIDNNQDEVSFAGTLAPLSLKLAGTPPLDLQAGESLAGPLAVQPAGGPILPVTMGWQAQRWMAEPLVISLKLLDREFGLGGERVATLGDRYPNVLWAPGEVVTETYPLRLAADAPPGLYRLELSLVRQDETLPDGFEYLPLAEGETTALYPATLRLLDPAHGSPPPQPVQAQLGDQIRLTGFEISQEVNPDDPGSPNVVSLALYWEASGMTGQNYTVFTQLIGPDGQVWAQWDNPPQGGRYPTGQWTAGDRVVDRYRLALREGAPPGDYRLLVGMYDPATGERLPATLDGQPVPDNALPLAVVGVGE